MHSRSTPVVLNDVQLQEVFKRTFACLINVIDLEPLLEGQPAEGVYHQLPLPEVRRLDE